jgi:hypothetical protein
MTLQETWRELVAERVRLKALLTSQALWGLADDDLRAQLADVEYLLRRLKEQLRTAPGNVA